MDALLVPSIVGGCMAGSLSALSHIKLTTFTSYEGIMPRKMLWQILAPLFRKVSSLLIMKKLDPNPFLDSIHGAIPSILSLGIIF